MMIHFRYTLLLVLSLPAFLFANTYYVSNTGNDSNSGLSSGDAFETLQHAADLVALGDSVLVEDGTYVGFDLRNTNGSASDPIVFMALGNNVVINQSGPLRDDGINIENADYIEIDGFIVNDMTGNGNGIRVVLSDHCVVRNCSCDNNAERGIFTGFTDDILIEYNICTNSIDEHGIYVSNSSDRPIIRYNECYGNNNIGIHMNGDLSQGGDGIISDAQIYGNIIYNNNLAAGINMDGLENPLVFNNLIFNNHFAQGIALFQQDGAIVTHAAKIYNNTIIVPSDGRWGILMTNGANVDTEIYNNIILNFHAWRGCITVEDTTDLTSDFNIVHDKLSDSGDGSSISFAQWQSLGFDSNSELADPLTDIFLDPSNDDYHLKEGSQGIDAGTSLVDQEVSDDLDQNPRPDGIAFDIGSYEYLNVVAVDYLQVLSGKIVDGYIELSWSHSGNPPIKEFQIQKSTDYLHWTTIGKVTPKEGTGIYRYWDLAPNLSANVYRIKSLDQNGTYSFSNSIQIQFDETDQEVEIFPVPSNDLINIKTKRTIHYASIHDASGNKVHEVKGRIIEKIDISHLSPGPYFLILRSDRSLIHLLFQVVR